MKLKTKIVKIETKNGEEYFTFTVDRYLDREVFETLLNVYKVNKHIDIILNPQEDDGNGRKIKNFE